MGKNITVQEDVNLRTGHMSGVARHASLNVGMMTLSVLLTACVLSRGIEGPVRTYQLTPEPGVLRIESRQFNGPGPILLVNLPQSDPGFDTQRMAYLTRPYEVNYFATSQWADTPARMLSMLLVRTFEQGRPWQAVVVSPTILRADYRVDVEGLVLVQEFVQSPSRARISWRAQLVDLRKGLVLGTRRFEGLQETSSDDAYGGVRAANQALGRLLADMASWLETCVSEQGKTAC